MDLAPDLAEQALDRRVDVLVLRAPTGLALLGDLRQSALDLVELVVA